MLRLLCLGLLAGLLCGPVAAQNVPLGTWGVHVPWQSAVDVAIDGQRVWGGLEASVVAVDRDDLSMTRYTKANGLSDVEVAAMASDQTAAAVVIAYANANIDIIQGNAIYNLPDVRNALITGDKSVNGIFTYRGTAWISTGFGIVRLNIANREISDTYFVGPGNTNLRINDLWADSAFVYAATADGVLRGTIDPFVNLSDADNPQSWFRFNYERHGLPETEADAVDALNGVMYAFLGDELFALPAGDTVWTPVPHDAGWFTRGTVSANGLLWLSQVRLDGEEVTGTRIGTFNGTTFSFPWGGGQQVPRPLNLAVDESGEVWYADLFAGLSRLSASGADRFVPNGPYKRTVFGMEYFDGSVYVASTGMSPTLNGDNVFLPYGFYRSTDQVWANFNEFNVSGLVGMEDVADIAAIPGEGKLLISAHANGLIEYDLATGATTVIERPSDDDGPFRSIALTTDASGNVWIANAYAGNTPLICRRPGGTYVNFTEKTGALLGTPINDIAVDQSGQIWMTTVNRGAYVYSYGGTFDSEADDVLKQIGTAYNIPSTDARCLAVDADGEVWIGTAAGLGVVFCPGVILNDQCAVDRICIPRQDTTNFCDNLLANEVVNCITVDAGNRKWIGTNTGVFLQSPDGLETVYRFTESNSPLLSNVVRSIEVDAGNGDVYIGTERGINTFRAEATLTDEDRSGDPFVYPNPVRPDYFGPIAIRNLPNNANVKIVDVAGHLVYETTSTGGQAVWDGLDSNGERPQSGVYIVLSADDDGKFRRTAKFVFIH